MKDVSLSVDSVLVQKSREKIPAENDQYVIIMFSQCGDQRTMSGLEQKLILCLCTPVLLNVPQMEGTYATGGGGGAHPFRGCTSGGVYVPYIYPHAR